MDHESWTRAVAAAIKADPTLRAIAASAVAEAELSDILGVAYPSRRPGPDLAPVPEHLRLMAQLSKVSAGLTTARYMLDDVIAADDLPADAARTYAAMCARLADQATGLGQLLVGITDADLARFLEADPS